MLPMRITSPRHLSKENFRFGCVARMIGRICSYLYVTRPPILSKNATSSSVASVVKHRAGSYLVVRYCLPELACTRPASSR